MSPFIKFTKKTEHTSGPKEELVFINADFISKATYCEKEESLSVIIVAPQFNRQSSEIITITGEEAAEAMKIIRDL